MIFDDDEDIFMDLDPNIIASHDDGQQKFHGNISAEKKTFFDCKSKNISRCIRISENTLIGHIKNVLCKSLPDDKNDYVHLYGYVFDKSTALKDNLQELFNLTFVNMYQLEMQSSNTKSACENFIDFFQYILLYIDNYLKYQNDSKVLSMSIWNNFQQLTFSLKPLKCLKLVGLTNQMQSHEIFHMNLNIRLYYLATCCKLLSGNEDSTQCTQYACEINNESLMYKFNLNSLKNDILLIMIQLTELTLKQFNHVSQVNDLVHLSPFKCDCICEFWILIRITCAKIDAKKNNELFWKNMSFILELMEKSAEQNIQDGMNETLDYCWEEVPLCIPCSKPYLYFIWFLKHLFSLGIDDHDPETEQKFNDDFEFTEKIVKKLTTLENIGETELRIILNFLDNIVSGKDSCKPDITITLWEYFLKRLNSNFILQSTPFAYNVSSLQRNTSIVDLANEIDTLLNPTRKHNTEENSYTLFLKMLGGYLLKYNHEQRIWNQIKGRMYSKFSQNKLSALSEQGIKNLSHLFILLFYIKRSQELVKIQTFLNTILSIKEKDPSSSATREIIMKVNLTFVLINIRNNSHIEPNMLSPIMHLIDHPNAPDYENIVKTYLQCIRDIFQESNDVTLGQHQLLGAWMKHLLLTSKPSANVNILFNMATLVLHALSPHHPVDKTSPLGNYYTSIMENIVPYALSHVDGQDNLTTFLSGLTIFMLSGGVQYKTDATQLLNNLLVNNVNYQLKMNFVKTLLCHEQMSSFNLASFVANVETILTQCYLLNLILSEHTDEKEEEAMMRYVNAHWLHKLKQKYSFQESQLIEAQVTHSDNEENLKHFLNQIKTIYDTVNETEARNQFYTQVSDLFSIEDQLKQVISSHDKTSTPSSKTIITKIFTYVALIIDTTGSLLYRKSKPNTQLQCYIDTLLLQFQIRNIEYKLSSNLTHALRLTMHIYINALMKLDPNNDVYIARTIRELIQIYLPRLINKTQYEIQFSLIKCFNRDDVTDRYLLELITSLFLRKKCKVSDVTSHDGVTFLFQLVNEYSNKQFTSSFIKVCFELLLNNIMSLNDIDVCKNKIKSIVKKCFVSSEIQNDSTVKNHMLVLLTKLANENLAFSFGQFFNLLNFLLPACPSVVVEFRRNILVQKIKAVEMKRGVEFDKVLRNCLEQLDKNIKRAVLIQS